MADEQQIDVAHSAEDRVGWGMTFIRAAEKVSLSLMRKCALAYPRLCELCAVSDPNLRPRPDFRKVQGHVVELARESVAEELLALQQETRSAGDQVRGRRKGHILTRLKRLMPCGATAMHAMCKPRGAITTDPAEMADILRTHWKEVFSKKAIDT
eukprot:3242730-Pyramimonas_sp.AAC.1